MVAEAAKPKGAGNRAQIAFASVGRYARGYFVPSACLLPKPGCASLLPNPWPLKERKGQRQGKGLWLHVGPLGLADDAPRQNSVLQSHDRFVSSHSLQKTFIMHAFVQLDDLLLQR